MIYFFSIAFIVVVVDQLSKLALVSYAAANNIPLSRELSHWFSFLNIIYNTNPGAAFGMFPDQRLFFVGISIVVVLAIIIYVWRYRNRISHWTNVGLALILGGAIGNNLIDRLVRGEVVDFIDFHIGQFHWPAFNIADTAICIGVGILILELFLKSKTRSDEHNLEDAR
jgi:signal peptidase II